MDAKIMIVPHDKIQFEYVNWKGESGTRRIEVGELYYGSTEYHPEFQWLLEGYDLDKKANRIFAMRDMSSIQRLK